MTGVPRFRPSDAVLCLYTTVRNMRPLRTYYGFLPPHGRRLDSCEEFTLPGDMMSEFKRQTHNDRARISFENALENGDIALISSPSVHLRDTVLDETKIVELTSGNLVLADPCWGQYSSTMCVPE